LEIIVLHSNMLTGLLPPLPFAQYAYCVLDRPSYCEPNCNHFKCPLPAGSEQCKYDSGGDHPGVHCK
jgi:hypothetical protein